MSPNKDKKEGKEKEGKIMGFLHLLEEMDKEKESETSGFGEVGGFDTKVKYGYSVKLEPELGDLPHHRGFHPIQKKRISKKRKGGE